MKPIRSRPLAADRQLQPGPLAVDRHRGRPEGERRSRRRAGRGRRWRSCGARPPPPAPARGGRSWRRAQRAPSSHTPSGAPPLSTANARSASLVRAGGIATRESPGREGRAPSTSATAARASRAPAPARPSAPAGPTSRAVRRRMASIAEAPEGAVRLAEQRDRPRDVGRRHRCAAQARPASPGHARHHPDPGAREVRLAHRALAAGEARDLPAGAHGPHREALGVDGRRRHAAPGVPGGEDGHDPELAPAPDDRAQQTAAAPRRSPRGVDDRREVRGGRVAVGIGDPLGGGHQRAEGGVAAAVERLGDDDPGPGGDPDGGAADGPADHRADGVRAVAVVVVGRRPPVREVAPGHDLPGQVGVIGVHAGVDGADRDAAAVQPVVAPHGGRADGRQAPVAPAEAPRQPLGAGRGRAEDPHRPVVLDPGDGRVAGQPPDLGRRRPQGERVHEPQPARRQALARQERPLRGPGRALEGADEVGGIGLVRGAHLGAEGHEDGQRPVGPREPGGQRRRERRRRRTARRGRRGARPGGEAPGRGDGGDGGEADERARPGHRWTPWASRSAGPTVGSGGCTAPNRR